MTVYLAAYGTLMTGKVNALSSRTRSRLVSLGPCRIPGAMFRVWDGSGDDRIDYPGLVPGGDSWVQGELFRIGGSDAEAADVLADMDIYEDCRSDDPAASSYMRVEVEVLRADGRATRAWVYYFNRPVLGLEAIPSGRWAPSINRTVCPDERCTRPYLR